MRAAGQLDVSQVGTAILETNGQLSAFPDSKYRPANTSELHISPDPESVPTVLMLDGRADDENLALLGRERTLICTLDRMGNLYAQDYTGASYKKRALTKEQAKV